MLLNSLKFRFALVITVLQAIVIAIILGVTLNKFFVATQLQWEATEGMLSNLISEFSRVALITSDFGELQPLVEKIVLDPHVEKVVLTDVDDLIVVSSDVADIGSNFSVGEKNSDTFWLHQKIANPSGTLGSLHVNYSNVSIIQSKDSAIKLGISIAIICISFIAVVGTFFGYLLTRRLDKVANTAKQIGQGKLDAKTNLVGKDEVAVVGQTIDYMGESIARMVEELNQQKYELNQARDSLEHRVQERTRELAIARDEALKASNAKSTFLANMSHELRTPLNAILGYSEMLVEGLRDEEDKSDAKSIHIAGKNLLALINNILDVERIEAGKLDFQISSFNIQSMLSNLESIFKPIASANNNQLEIILNTGVEEMIADEGAIHQVLLNLLSNAAKFTKGGEIAVRVSSFQNEGEEWLNFTVSDTGIGIDSNNISRLFEKFYQVDSSFTKEYQGVGLGLSICYNLVHAMGGHFKVSSELNEGASFSLLIARDIKEKIKTAA